MKLPHSRKKYIGFVTTAMALAGAAANTPYMLRGFIGNAVSFAVCMVCAVVCVVFGTRTWDLFE